MIAGGVVTAEEAVAAGLSVHQEGRSHAMFRVDVGGVPRAYVKGFGPRRGESDGSAAQERAVLTLAKSRPEVAALVPSALPWHGPPGIVVTQAIPGRAAWADEMEGGAPGALWADLVARLAGPLAALHRATRDLAAPGATPPDPLTGPEPWGLRLASGDAPPEIWATPQLAPALMRIVHDPALAEGLREARAGWRRLCLIHADLKHDNILLVDGEDSPRVAVVDWEMARLGDPAWDLAALAARLPMTALGEDPWGAQTVERTAALISVHAAASRLPGPALARRMPGYLATWLVMAAIQHQSTLAPGQPDDGAGELLDKAAQGFARRDALSRSLIDAVA
jgi:Ser/Thr protein kinase RdoA (MazF antagonist)